jgi:hypothetical protein
VRQLPRYDCAPQYQKYAIWCYVRLSLYIIPYS